MDPAIRNLVQARLEEETSRPRRVGRSRPRSPRRPRRARGGARGQRRRLAARSRRADAPGARRRVSPLDRRRGVPRDRPLADPGAAAGPGPHARRGAQRVRQVEPRRGPRGPPHRRQPALEGAGGRLARGLAQPPSPRSVARRDVPRRGRAGSVRGVAPVGSRGGSSREPRCRPSFTTSRRRSSTRSAGPRPCAPTVRSCPTTSWARSSTRGPRSSTTPSPRSWASKTSSLALGALQEARRSREKALKDATDARGAPPRAVARRRRPPRPARGHGRGRQGVGPRPRSTRCSAGSAPRARERAKRTCSGESRASSRPTRRGSRRPPRRCGRRPRPSAPRPETAAARSRDAAALLESALHYHEAHGDGDCPVCGRKGALDGAWSRKQREAAARLRESAREAEAVHERADAARRQWEGLVALKPDAFARAAEVGLDLGPLVEALGTWVQAGSIARPRRARRPRRGGQRPAAGGGRRAARLRAREARAQGGRVAPPGRRGRGLARGGPRGRGAEPPT